MNLAGEELSNKYKPAIWLAGSASAEFFADIALCPLEMTKVKIQTSPNGTFPTAFGAALAEMRTRRIETRYPFGSIVPLWSRQVGVERAVRYRIDIPMLVRSPIPWPNFFSSKASYSNFIRTCSRPQRSPTPSRPSSVSRSPLGISQA